MAAKKQNAVKTNTYEAMFLIGPAANQENEGGVGLARTVIERHGGQILHIKKWDERKLAYEVKKQKRGTYIIAFFKAPGGGITPLEREVKLSDDFLRVLVTRADHLTQKEMEAVEPQPIIREERQAFGYGTERSDRRDNAWSDRPERGDRPPRPRREEESQMEMSDKE